MNGAIDATVSLQTSVADLIAALFFIYLLIGIPLDIFLFILHIYQNGVNKIDAYFWDPVSDYLRALPLSLASYIGSGIIIRIRRVLVRLLIFVDQTDESKSGSDPDNDLTTDTTAAPNKSVADEPDTQVYQGEE
jgi:hypothetical protein